MPANKLNRLVEGDMPAADLMAEIARLKHDLACAEAKIAELEARADIDPLLDILNRRGFERELARSLAYVKRYGTAAALVYIDLDGFKPINDAYGHAAGDALLRAVAAALMRNVRASDMVARLGGDEFGVLMWHVGEALAMTKAAELERIVARVCVVHQTANNETAQLSVGASAGAAALVPGAGVAATIDAADKAMYVRKKGRRA